MASLSLGHRHLEQNAAAAVSHLERQAISDCLIHSDFTFGVQHLGSGCIEAGKVIALAILQQQALTTQVKKY